MHYTSPEFSELLQNIPNKTLLADETPPHLLLADQLAIIIEFISEQEKANSNNQKELVSNLVGAHIYYLEIISQEYHFHSPELKKGYIYDSGSPLYSFIAKALNITEKNKLTARDKFIFLIKFNQFITQKSSELETQLKPVSGNIIELQNKIKKMLNNLLYILTNDIAIIVNAVPTEKAVTKHMHDLSDDYQLEKATQGNGWYSYFFPADKSHAMLTQLAQLISNIQCEDESLLPVNVMTRSQRIKMGLLKYISKKVEKEYWIRSATNSVLYRKNKKILNSHSVENLNPSQTLACLSAFHSFINSNDERAKLEKAAREHFKENNLLENIDAVLNLLCNHLIEMEKELENATSTNWPATKTMSAMGMILGAAPSYGFGTIIGNTVSDTQASLHAKTAVGAAASNIATAVFQFSPSASYFSFVMGDFLIRSTLTRAFAKLFEFVGMAVGGVAGGLIGFTFDLTYKGLREVCKRLLNYCDENPIQMRNADREFIQCLLELPPDIFSDEKQNQILYTQGLECKDEENNKEFTCSQ